MRTPHFVSAEESVLVQFLGTLGLLESWIFIVYDFGKGGDFTNFEGVRARYTKHNGNCSVQFCRYPFFYGGLYT